MSYKHCTGSQAPRSDGKEYIKYIRAAGLRSTHRTLSWSVLEIGKYNRRTSIYTCNPFDGGTAARFRCVSFLVCRLIFLCCWCSSDANSSDASLRDFLIHETLIFKFYFLYWECIFHLSARPGLLKKNLTDLALTCFSYISCGPFWCCCYTDSLYCTYTLICATRFALVIFNISFFFGCWVRARFLLVFLAL